MGWLVAVPFGLAVLGALAYSGWMLAGEPRGLSTASDLAYDGAIALAGVACRLALICRLECGAPGWPLPWGCSGGRPATLDGI